MISKRTSEKYISTRLHDAIFRRENLISHKRFRVVSYDYGLPMMLLPYLKSTLRHNQIKTIIDTVKWSTWTDIYWQNEGQTNVWAVNCWHLLNKVRTNSCNRR